MSSNPATQFNIQIGDQLTWNVKPLLHEIRHALQDLAEHGRSAIIDLRSIPLAPGEEEKILATLGRGEVSAQIDALGPSEVIETAYPGVWLVTHYNSEEDIIGRFIEITAMPEILCSQTLEISQSGLRLAACLEQAEADPAISEETVS
jgi:hydrogenase-1 operon protein HyaF